MSRIVIIDRRRLEKFIALIGGRLRFGLPCAPQTFDFDRLRRSSSPCREKAASRNLSVSPSPRERQGYRIWKFPSPRHPGQGREAPAEPGSIGRVIVRNGPVLAPARFSTLVAVPQPGRAAQWIPDSLRFAPASGMTGEAPRHMRLPCRSRGEVARRAG